MRGDREQVSTDTGGDNRKSNTGGKIYKEEKMN